MKKLLRFFILLLAAIIYSAGISLFLDPNNLAPGGVTGVAILLNRYAGIETGTWILFLNVPIMVIGMKKFGWRLVASTIYMLVLISVFTNLFSIYFNAMSNDRLVSAVIGGSMVAVGIGASFMLDATTGGVDIIVKMLRLRFRHLKAGSLFIAIDLVVVSLAGIVFRDVNSAVYAMISVLISSYVLDSILYGRDEAKMIYVISDESEKISRRILKELAIGATYLDGEGAYYQKRKKVILCVMRKQIAPKAIQIIQTEDPEAFLIITSANEIYGEGYK